MVYKKVHIYIIDSNVFDRNRTWKYTCTKITFPRPTLTATLQTITCVTINNMASKEICRKEYGKQIKILKEIKNRYNLFYMLILFMPWLLLRLLKG